MGWDCLVLAYNIGRRYFNPPIPCGMGHVRVTNSSFRSPFQSTHPVWDGTRAEILRPRAIAFQSTHPVWDGTDRSQHQQLNGYDFNPPIPCGMGQTPLALLCRRCVFQSTHPVWDGTTAISAQHILASHFNPPIPCGMGHCPTLLDNGF